ncbi:MAG: signal peptidase II [Burkholderiaceae bacterium]
MALAGSRGPGAAGRRAHQGADPQTYQLGESTFVTSFFNVVRVHNTGAAFSFLAQAGGWRWMFTSHRCGRGGVHHRHAALAQRSEAVFLRTGVCILGDAIGNVVDRVLRVCDRRLDFHFAFLSGVFHGGHFPAFNIADAGITLGAICLILDEILRVRRTR